MRRALRSRCVLQSGRAEAAVAPPRFLGYCGVGGRDRLLLSGCLRDGSGLRSVGLGLDGDAWQVSVEGAGEFPGAVAEELEHGGEEDHADDDGVEEDRGGQSDPE